MLSGDNLPQIQPLASFGTDYAKHAYWLGDNQHLLVQTKTQILWYDLTGEPVLARKWGIDSGKITASAISMDRGLLAITIERQIPTPTKGDYVVEVRIMEADSGKIIQAIDKHRYSVHTLLFSPNREYLMVASHPESTVWHVWTGEPVGHIPFHIETMAFDATDSTLYFLAHAVHNYELKEWKPNTQQIHDLPFEVGDKLFTAFHMDQKHAYLLDSDRQTKRLACFNLRSHETWLIGEYPSHPIVDQIAFSSDGNQLALYSMYSGIKVYDVPTQSEIQTLERPERIVALAYTPDGQWLLGFSLVNIFVWDTTHWQLAHALDDYCYLYRYPFSFSPDSRRFAIAGGSLWWWDMGQHSSAHSLTGHAGQIVSLVSSISGRYLVAGNSNSDENGMVRVWDVQTSAYQEYPLPEKHISVFTVAISPDESLVASGSEQGFVTIWSRQTGEQVALLEHKFAYDNYIYGLVFSPDGAWLATSERDGYVRLWEMATFLSHWSKKMSE